MNLAVKTYIDHCSVQTLDTVLTTYQELWIIGMDGEIVKIIHAVNTPWWKHHKQSSAIEGIGTYVLVQLCPEDIFDHGKGFLVWSYSLQDFHIHISTHIHQTSYIDVLSHLLDFIAYQHLMALVHTHNHIYMYYSVQLNRSQE